MFLLIVLISFLQPPRPSPVTSQTVARLPARARAGCPRLERLSLQSCEGVTDKGVIVALEHLEHLRQLDYHQKFSLLEILIRWSSNHHNSERMMQLFQLTDLEHGKNDDDDDDDDDDNDDDHHRLPVLGVATGVAAD